MNYLNLEKLDEYDLEFLATTIIEIELEHPHYLYYLTVDCVHEDPCVVLKMHDSQEANFLYYAFIEDNKSFLANHNFRDIKSLVTLIDESITAEKRRRLSNKLEKELNNANITIAKTNKI